MKVLDAPVWWDFVCVACGAHCQAEPTDVTSRSNMDCDGNKIGRISVVECGRGGKQHDVPDNLVTEKIERIAARKRRRGEDGD